MLGGLTYSSPPDIAFASPADYSFTTVNYGSSNHVEMTYSSPDATIIGGIHTHPSGHYTAPSAADIYAFHNMNAGNNNFQFYFTWAADGSKYAMTITDATAFNNFVTTYPKSNNITPDNQWNINSTIGKEFRNTVSFLTMRQNMSKQTAYENAFAYILGKYTGVTLSKQDTNGDFKSIYVKEDPDEKATQNSNPVLPATSICN